MPPFDAERRKMYGIRCTIGELQGYLRTIYGNKWTPRYNDPMWQRIQEHLKKACSEIFEAEKEIFTLPEAPEE